MTIRCAVFVLLAWRGLGAPSNASSCQDSVGCVQLSSAGSAKWAMPSLVPAVQSMPFAVPLIMAWDGFPAARFHAFIAQHLGPANSETGVHRRVACAIVVIALLSFAMTFGVLIMQATADRPSRDRAMFVEKHGENEETTRMRLSFSQHCDIEQLKSLDAESEDFIEIQLSELIEKSGVSGFCICNPHEQSPTAKLPLWLALSLISFQGLLLQGGLLYFMVLELRPDDGKRKTDLSPCVLFIAIYIHFLNVAQDIPTSFQLVRHLWDFHRNVPDMLRMAPLLAIDAIVVPTLVVFIGSLYISISRSAVDVILNSVAVAFVKDIDNWILSLVTHASLFAGTLTHKTVRLPAAHESMRKILLTVCYCPVVPVTVTLLMLWLALCVFKL